MGSESTAIRRKISAKGEQLNRRLERLQQRFSIGDRRQACPPAADHGPNLRSRAAPAPAAASRPAPRESPLEPAGTAQSASPSCSRHSRATAVASRRSASGAGTHNHHLHRIEQQPLQRQPVTACVQGRSAPRCPQSRPACLRRYRDTPGARSAPQGAAAQKRPWGCRPVLASPAAVCAALPVRPAVSARPRSPPHRRTHPQCAS